MTAEEEVQVSQLREEVGRLQAENQQLREQLVQALALIAKLQSELEHLRANPPPSIKPNTPKPTDKDKDKDKADKIRTIRLTR
jgi:regulator of replication initiation timing